jgi:preprotein translocase subunit SecG
MGFYTVLLVIHSIVVLFLIMMVLVQRTESDGMGGLSGGGGNQFLTGRSSANLMTRTTAILAAVFMTTSLTLAVIANRMTDTGSILDKVNPAHIEEPASMDIAPEADKAKAVKGKKSEAVKPETAPKDAEEPAKATPAVPKPE